MILSHMISWPMLLAFALLHAVTTAEEQIVFEVLKNRDTYLNDTSASISVDDLFVSADESAKQASFCCATLNSLLPGKVFFPESDEFKSQQASYYSLPQSDLHPNCRASPSSANDVSAIVGVAGKQGCEFAVRGGGHMSWKGSSNIGRFGFTIDLQHTIALSKDHSVVSIGAGASWRMVYHALDPYNVTTVGGRTSDVGVSGFLLGGGISYLSLEHGFGSDNVVAYEVVVADGTICLATVYSHPDLYWALKYGSTNFGIVTRFDMTTFPQGDVWGGAFYYSISDALPLLDSLVTSTANLATDPHGMSAFGFFWNADAQAHIVWGPTVYLKPIPFPSVFSELYKIKPLSSTMRIARMTEITDDLSAMFPRGVRTQWATLTLRANAQIVLNIQKHGAQFFEADRARPGFMDGVTVQPINIGLIAAGSKNGGNPIGMSTDDGDLFLLHLSLFWSNPADDEILVPKFQEYTAWVEDYARKSGSLAEFLYMNYALENQDVMASVGMENRRKLKDVQGRYDSNGIFTKYWKGGYKL